MKATLTEGSVRRQLIKLALPMSVGIFTIICFSLVDTFFVGQLGRDELAAMTFTFPVPMVITSVAFAIGVAVSSLVSRSVGAGDDHTVTLLTTHSLVLVTIIVVSLSLLGVATIDPLFQLLGASQNLMPLIHDYMEIWYLGMPFIVIPMVGNSVIRALGDASFPAVVMVVAGVVNGILDPCLIFGWWIFPEWGLKGAAVATLVSQLCAFVAGLAVLHFKYQIVTNPLLHLRSLWPSWKAIGLLAAPAFLTNLIAPFTAGFVTRLVSQYGESVVAGFGVGARIESFLSIPLMGLAASLGPFVGQNYGAKEYARIRSAVLFSQAVVWFWAVACFVTMLLWAEPLAAIFNRDPLVTESARTYLLIVTLGLVGTGVLQNAVSVFNVLGQPRIALLVTFIKVGVLYIPFALLLRYPLAEAGIYTAALLSHLGAGMIIALYLRRFIGGCQEKRKNVPGYLFTPRAH